MTHTAHIQPTPRHYKDRTPILGIHRTHTTPTQNTHIYTALTRRTEDTYSTHSTTTPHTHECKSALQHHSQCPDATYTTHVPNPRLSQDTGCTHLSSKHRKPSPSSQHTQTHIHTVRETHTMHVTHVLYTHPSKTIHSRHTPYTHISSTFS